MSDPVVESLIVDLLEWISNRPERTYEQVMEAWRTSCPRLTVWEDANDRGLVTTEYINGHNLVKLTTAGLTHLANRDDKRQSHPSEDRDRHPLSEQDNTL